MVNLEYSMENKISYTPDELDSLLKEHDKKMKQHLDTAPNTINLIKRMEDKFDNLKDELTSKMTNLEVLIAGLPQKFYDKCDNKYAEKRIEKEVKELRDKKEERNYQWLAWGITSTILLLVAKFL